MDQEICLLFRQTDNSWFASLPCPALPYPTLPYPSLSRTGKREGGREGIREEAQALFFFFFFAY